MGRLAELWSAVRVYEAAVAKRVQSFLKRFHRLIHGVLVAVAFAASCWFAWLLISGDHGFWRDYYAARPFLYVAAACALLAAILAHANFELHGRVDSPGLTTMTRFSHWRGDEISTEQARFFAQAILKPMEIFSRIRETVSPLARATEVRTAYTVKLPAEKSGEVYVYLPFTLERKGRLFDDLLINAVGGNEHASLSYSDYLQLVSAVLAELAASDGPEALRRYAAIEAKMMGMIADRAPQADRGDEVDAAFNEIDVDPEHPEDRTRADTDARRSMRSIIKMLIAHYAVVLKLPVASSADGQQWEQIVTAERRLFPLDAPRLTDPIAWIFDRVRRILGVRPNQFVLPLDKAQLTSSYHVEYMGPPGTYLSRQDLLDYDEKAPHYRRIRSRFGQRYAHLYIRGAPIESSKWRLRVSFFERPPGSVGAAAISAFASFCLILVAGRLAMKMPTPGSLKDVPGDMIAILLSFPAIGAAWIGLDRGPVPFGGTMATRLSSLANFLTTIAAVALYSGAFPNPDEFKRELSILGAQGVWAILVSIAGINLAWIAYGWTRRSWLYSSMLSRQKEDLEPRSLLV